MKVVRKHLLLALILIILGTLAGCKSNPPPIPPSSNLPVEEPAPVAPTPVETPAPPPVTEQGKSLSWWFTRNQSHSIPSVNKDITALLAANNAFYVLPNSTQRIYLTFDAGYELGYTGKILDTLKNQRIKAAFFITGQFIQTQPDLVKRMQSEGHLVCNHTYNHPDLSTISQAKFNQEITSLEQKYTQLTGAAMPHYLRPPMGNYSAASLNWANVLGYQTVFWSIAFNDWDPNKQPGAEYSYQHVLGNIHPGAVILLHAVSQSDTEALAKIITDLKSQGYVFSTFDGQ